MWQNNVLMLLHKAYTHKGKELNNRRVILYIVNNIKIATDINGPSKIDNTQYHKRKCDSCLADKLPCVRYVPLFAVQ